MALYTLLSIWTKSPSLYGYHYDQLNGLGGLFTSSTKFHGLLSPAYPGLLSLVDAAGKSAL